MERLKELYRMDYHKLRINKPFDQLIANHLQLLDLALPLNIHNLWMFSESLPIGLFRYLQVHWTLFVCNWPFTLEQFTGKKVNIQVRIEKEE